MPPFESFRDADSYYSTLAHELTHWTAAKTRLDRDFGGHRFGSNAYAQEELVAELGAAFLCADLELALEPREDHAAYIAQLAGSPEERQPRDLHRRRARAEGRRLHPQIQRQHRRESRGAPCGLKSFALAGSFCQDGESEQSLPLCRFSSPAIQRHRKGVGCDSGTRLGSVVLVMSSQQAIATGYAGTGDLADSIPVMIFNEQTITRLLGSIEANNLVLLSAQDRQFRRQVISCQQRVSLALATTNIRQSGPCLRR